MNDMSILDFQGPYNSFYFFENMFSVVALIINVFQMNLYFLIPGAIGVILFTIFYFRISDAIIQLKYLDLETKSSLFNIIL